MVSVNGVLQKAAPSALSTSNNFFGRHGAARSGMVGSGAVWHGLAGLDNFLGGCYYGDYFLEIG